MSLGEEESYTVDIKDNILSTHAQRTKYPVDRYPDDRGIWTPSTLKTTRDGEEVVLTLPRTDIGWCDFANIEAYRALPGFNRKSHLYSLQALAAIALGHGLTPEKLAPLSQEQRELVQMHTPWYWQVGTFNPIRFWVAEPVLMREAYVAYDTEKKQWVYHGTDIKNRILGTTNSSYIREYHMGKLHGLSIKRCGCGPLHAEELQRGNNPNRMRWHCVYYGHHSRTERTYRDGIKHGISKYWNYDDDTYEEVTYASGEIDGDYYRYKLSTGAIVAHNTHQRGKAHGLSREWTPDGVLWSAKSYTSGNRNGQSMYMRRGRYGLCTEIITWKYGMKLCKYVCPEPLMIIADWLKNDITNNIIQRSEQILAGPPTTDDDLREFKLDQASVARRMTKWNADWYKTYALDRTPRAKIKEAILNTTTRSDWGSGRSSLPQIQERVHASGITGYFDYLVTEDDLYVDVLLRHHYAPFQGRKDVFLRKLTVVLERIITCRQQEILYAPLGSALVAQHLIKRIEEQDADSDNEDYYIESSEEMLDIVATTARAYVTAVAIVFRRPEMYGISPEELPHELYERVCRDLPE